jgi:RHH-type proline utilization regulon transcriptional repressor/proline dehydrogenase/delta 1-pyrroline-5-carboxylate dehydrogenase
MSAAAAGSGVGAGDGTMLFRTPPPLAREELHRLTLADEVDLVTSLLARPPLESRSRELAVLRAQRYVTDVRRRYGKGRGLEALLHEYDLSSEEGVVLMCLAEALLRIPDGATQDLLIRDKLGHAHFADHIRQGGTLWANASAWGLALTGKILGPDTEWSEQGEGIFRRWMSRVGEPVVRAAVVRTMKMMGEHFVMAPSMEDARRRLKPGWLYSFDMLGEAALTRADAERYYESYRAAIRSVAAFPGGRDEPLSRHGVSVKLSALHPRYEYARREDVRRELGPVLADLLEEARRAGVPLTVDAEEASRLELSLELILDLHAAAGNDDGVLGLAVQAYSKRTLPLIRILSETARQRRRRLAVRLVKGAYWDSEIKTAQYEGLADYPVFTRKSATDVSYLHCARELFEASPWLYPQFATHNAHTLAAVLEMARGRSLPFEFQKLYGMGDALYEVAREDEELRGVPVRVYAPVGAYHDLLPYLVRRLLENGANSSFVNRLEDAGTPVEELVRDPFEVLSAASVKRHPTIPPPPRLYGDLRRNSPGVNRHDTATLLDLARRMEEALVSPHEARPRIDGKPRTGRARPCVAPADHREHLGTVHEVIDRSTIDTAVETALWAQPAWNARGGEERARVLEAAAVRFEAAYAELLALVMREAGKSLRDAIAEVREAIDYLLYYAACARRDFASPVVLPGPTGERNELWWEGRGVFACVSPWNFPLAIFTGQVAAALAAGNTVVAKPAEQTPLVAARAVELLHAAGVPPAALAFLPGDGPTVGAPLCADPRIAGVAFTGSTATARAIARALAERDGPLAVLIAETGGLNAMVVDSSALPEQVVLDVVESAFQSAGQRCSALRLLCLQEEIAPRILELLVGHMDLLRIGDPRWLDVDVGPVIDEDARVRLRDYCERVRSEGRELHALALTDEARYGTFVAPTLVRVDRVADIPGEVFGPVLHVLRYRREHLRDLMRDLRATGYGLTFGIHSRVDTRARALWRESLAGNTYVNRNMIGAVVGVQPFGGQGLSGTGPKAGGPHYLHRFAVERTLTVNTAAAGGNASLLNQEEDG